VKWIRKARVGRIFGILLPLGTMVCLGTGCATRATPIRHVIHISVDGLRPDAVTTRSEAELPNFYRLRHEGAFTDNARTDHEFTVTLPNHTCQLTGRPVESADGHNWASNGNPPEGATLASNKGEYVAGVFDVAHDHGLLTGQYASKSKFELFVTTWDSANGAADLVRPDHGRGKLDVSVIEPDTTELVRRLLEEMSTHPFGYVFLHLRDPDSTGHASGWDLTLGTPYMESVKYVDGLLGQLLGCIDTEQQLGGRTAIILTADHGGLEKSHGNVALKDNYTVPFYVWGPGVAKAGDLYQLNRATRQDPGEGRIPPSAPLPPIRNGDAANLALKLLGLPPVPGSVIGAKQDLAVSTRGSPLSNEARTAIATAAP